MKKRTILFLVIVFVCHPVFSYAAEQFKEPVLLWEKEFDPPIREISDQNSNGDFLAIQLDKEARHAHKILVIDPKGSIKREEDMPAKKKKTIPADLLWLTASSEEELKQLRKATKPRQIDAWGRELYISGNGEYYAVVTQYGSWYEFEYKDKNGKTLWTINPKDNYGFEKAFISHDGSRVVIINMGGLGGGDEWEVLGQRVYFYDNTGKLLRDYDYGKKMEEWIHPEVGKVHISKDGKYFIAPRGFRNPNYDTSISLYSADGNMLWEKSFGTGKHWPALDECMGKTYPRISYKNIQYWLDSAGEIIKDPPCSYKKIEWKTREDERTYGYRIFDRKKGDLVYYLVSEYLEIIEPIRFVSMKKGSLYVFEYRAGDKIAQLEGFLAGASFVGISFFNGNRFIVMDYKKDSQRYIKLYNNELRELLQKDFDKYPHVDISGNLLKVMISFMRAKRIYIYDLSKCEEN